MLTRHLITVADLITAKIKTAPSSDACSSTCHSLHPANFPISDLNLGVTPVSGGSLTFNCVANTHGTFTVNSALAPLSPSTPKTDN